MYQEIIYLPKTTITTYFWEENKLTTKKPQGQKTGIIQVAFINHM